MAKIQPSRRVEPQPYILTYIYSTSWFVYLTDWWISWRATDCRCTCNNWAYHLLNARRILLMARAVQFIWGFESLCHQQSQMIGKVSESPEKYLALRRIRCTRGDPVRLMAQRLKQWKIIAVPDEVGYTSNCCMFFKLWLKLYV